MKKIISILSLSIVAVVALPSCQKCTTCTYTPADNGVVVSGDTASTVEVCESGRIYDNAITRYQDSGWECE